MNTIGRLGELYNLSPSTLAGLANAAGTPAVDPDSPEAWQADQERAAAKAGLPPVAPIQQGATYASASNNERTAKADESAGADERKQRGLDEHGFPVNMTDRDWESYVRTKGGLDAATSGWTNKAGATMPPGVVVSPTAGATAGQSAPAYDVTPIRTTPAHWQSNTHEVDLKHGVNPDALLPGLEAKAKGWQLADEGAGQRLTADRMNLQADVQDGQRAAVQLTAARNQLATIDGQRDAYKRREMDQLGSLNARAQKEVSTNEAFRGGDIGRVMAAVFMGMGQFASTWKGGTNGALQVVDDAVKSTIERQKANAANARGAFADRAELYRDNMHAFGEQRAELATRIQLLGKVAEMADERHAGAKDLQLTAGYNQFKAGLDEKIGSALDEFGKLTDAQIAEKMSEKFMPASTTGGVQSKREGNLVTLSDGTTFVMPSQEVAQKSIEKIQVLDKLERNNNEILKLREKASRLDPVLNYTEFNSTIQQLRDLGEQKVALTSLALGQGVVKEEEYKRAQEINVGVTNGLGTFKGTPWQQSERESTDNMLRAQTKRWGEDQRSFVTSAGGSVYERGYARDAHGNLKPVGQYTGQDATPTQNLAPQGSVPMNGTTPVPTAGPKASTQIPLAPRMDR